MSNVTVLIFEHEHEAREVRQALARLQHEEQIHVDDAAIIVKEMSGKIKVDNEVETSTKTGAVIGGLLGPLIFLMFPVAGIVMGAAGGALIGKMVDSGGVDKGFVKDVTNALEPGNSALLVATSHGNLTAVLGALRPYKGRVFETSLTEENEESLRRALE